MTATTDQILALKQRVERATKLRSDAEVAQKVAAAQLTKIDDELRGLGIDPEQAPQELAALDAQIAVQTAEVDAQAAAETAAYEAILATAQQAGVVR